MTEEGHKAVITAIDMPGDCPVIGYVIENDLDNQPTLTSWTFDGYALPCRTAHEFDLLEVPRDGSELQKEIDDLQATILEQAAKIAELSHPRNISHTDSLEAQVVILIKENRDLRVRLSQAGNLVITEAGAHAAELISEEGLQLRPVHHSGMIGYKFVDIHGRTVLTDVTGVDVKTGKQVLFTVTRLD